MRRLFPFVLAMALVVASCGGQTGSEPGEDEGGTTTARGDTTEPSETVDETTPPTEANEDESDDSEGSGPSMATVTIGEETFAFSTEGAVVAQCLTDLFGIFSVQLPEVDGDGSVSIVALREGTDPETVGEVNAIQVDVGDETWVADEGDDMFDQFEQLEPGMSQVDSIEIEGRTVRGTATFFRQNSLFGGGEVETATGSFEATCGEERTS